MAVDLLVFDVTPKPFLHDVVPSGALAIHADLLCEMIGFAAPKLLELEVGTFTMAAHGEKSLMRLARRNGNRLCRRARAPGQPEGMGHRSVQPAARPSPACQQHPRCPPALLKGLLNGPDGAALSPTHTRKGDLLYRYYVSQTVLKHGSGKCPVARVPAAEIEAAIIEQIRGMRRVPELVVATWRAAQPECEDLAEDELRGALVALDPPWAELFPTGQACIIQLA